MLLDVRACRPAPPPVPPVPSEGDLLARYSWGEAYDEMFVRTGDARACYRPLLDELRAASAAELHRCQLDADRAFLTRGITFTVYGDEQRSAAS